MNAQQYHGKFAVANGNKHFINSVILHKVFGSRPLKHFSKETGQGN